MAWARLDDAFPEDPKILACDGVEAALVTALQVRAICYCSHHLTDGYLPPGAIEKFLVGFPPGNWSEKMISLGLWEVCENYATCIASASRSGLLVHDYLVYNPSKKMVIALRNQRREAAKLRWRKVVAPHAKCIRPASVVAHHTTHLPYPLSTEDQTLPPHTPPSGKVINNRPSFASPSASGEKAGRDPAPGKRESRIVPEESDAPDSRRGGAPSGASPPPPTLPQEGRSDSRTEDERQDGENVEPCPDCGRVVALLNELAGRKFGRNLTALKNLHARHKEFGLDACERIVRVMVLSWLGTKWEEFLAPTTLFRPTKFERYMNQRPPAVPPQRKFDSLSATDAEELRKRREMLDRISPERRDACLSYLRHSVARVEKELEKAKARSEGPAYLSQGSASEADRLSSRLEELRAEVAFLEAAKEV